MSDVISDVIFDTNIVYDDDMTQEKYDALPEEKQAEYSKVIKGGQTRFARSKDQLDTSVTSPKQAKVDKKEGELSKEKEMKDAEKAAEKASKEDYNYGDDRYGTEEASATIEKSKAGEDVWGVTGGGSEGEFLKAAKQKQSNVEELRKSKNYLDDKERKEKGVKELKAKEEEAREKFKEDFNRGKKLREEIKDLDKQIEETYNLRVGASATDEDKNYRDQLNKKRLELRIEKKKKEQEYKNEIGDRIKAAIESGKEYNEAAFERFKEEHTKTKSEKIEDALKYRGIGYLNWIRKQGIIDDKEYEKYKNQIQEVRDIRKPGIAKALNTAYLIYNAIANGFRNMGNLAFNVAGKGQVQYSQSALGNMLENAFEKAQEVNVAREKGAMEDVFDWQKSKRGIVLDSEKAFRDWGIKARENWSEWDRQTATNVISSFLLKDQKAFDEYMRRSGYTWDKTFAADFGKYLNKMSKKERQDFISGLFVQAADSPDGLIKMLTSLTTMPRQAAYKYYFENDAEYFDDVENAINNLEISEEKRQKLIDEYEKEKLKQEEENRKQDIKDGWKVLNTIIPANTKENADFSNRISAAKNKEEIDRVIDDAKKFAAEQKK